MGTNVDYDAQVAYVAELLDTQMQILTISQIAEKVAFATFVMAFFAIFFRDHKPQLKPA